MLIVKKGYPEKAELLVCTVTKIQFNSIFVRVDEYERRQGIIHISEISPGRIRNIRDYVKEGKVIVCVVLHVNKERDLIDLSLRRVQDGQKRKKINDMKQEQKAAKLIEFVAKSAKKDNKKLVDNIISSISDDYDSVHTYFEDIVAGLETIDRLNIETDTKKILEETIRQKIKPPEVNIKGRIFVRSYEENGLEIIKEGMLQAQKINPLHVKILFLGAGKFDISVRAEDYKTAEKILQSVHESVALHMKKHKSEIDFQRTDK